MLLTIKNKSKLANKKFPIVSDTACQLKWNWSTVFLSTGETASCHRTDQHKFDTDKFDFQLTLIIIVIALVIIYLYFQVYLNFQIAWLFYYLRFSKSLPGFLGILFQFNSFFTFQFPSFFSLNQAFPAFSLSQFQAY